MDYIALRRIETTKGTFEMEGGHIQGTFTQENSHKLPSSRSIQYAGEGGSRGDSGGSTIAARA
jgi:hypothetical protein